MDWCRRFCGSFPDEHVDHTDDPDDPEPPPRFEHMVGGKHKESSWSRWFSRKKKTDGSESKGRGTIQSSGVMWQSFITWTTASMKGGKAGQETMQKVIILAGKQKNVKQGMLNNISDVGPVHTIDLEDCKLTDVPPYLDNVDTLVVLQLIRNKIRKVPKELGMCSKLERLNLGYNNISMLDVELFSEQNFPLLEVLTLRHNRLEILPSNFGITAAKPCKLKHLDLSENKIQAMPDSFMQMKDSLVFLDLSHNKFMRLPKDFEFRKLQKLFISFNHLVELPDGLGECQELEKIRMTNNDVRKLPDSVLKLKGTLQVFEVEGNPLVTPSITAFQMGGLQQAFKLLEEHVNHVRRVQEAMKTPALMPRADQPGEAENVGQKFLQDTAEQEKVEDDMANIKTHDAHQIYYFSHCKGEDAEEQIREIRNAESTLLIIKRNVYFQSQKNLARAAHGPPGEENIENVPTTLRQFLDPKYDVSKWHGVARVTDLDLYFNLLVYATKPQYSTCATLFDRFEMDDKGYLNKDEWNEFLLFSPILLEDPKVNDGMWELMAWRHGDRITLTDFVAAWHIHDVEIPDPWIQRMAKVLRLDYYEMPLPELQARLRAKDAEEATPQLNFDMDSSDSDEAEESYIKMDQVEGERWVIPKSLQRDPKKEDKKGEFKTEQSKAKKHVKELENLTSMNDAQFADYKQAQNTGDQSSSDESEASMRSGELSDSSDSDVESDFDAVARRHGGFLTSENDAGQFQVDSQEGMDKLMLLDPKSFFRPKPSAEAPSASASQARGATKKTKDKVPKGKGGGGRYKTDIFPVKQEIRRVYRNLPYDDFVKLISFLLRGMQMIKHARSKKNATYWHADDPTFLFTMGATESNVYTRRLLIDMGFALLDHIYWVWPDVHMQEATRMAKKGVPVWGDEEIPKDCPGREKERLDDMIQLFTSCQRSLHKLGKDFNGIFR